MYAETSVRDQCWSRAAGGHDAGASTARDKLDALARGLGKSGLNYDPSRHTDVAPHVHVHRSNTPMRGVAFVPMVVVPASLMTDLKVSERCRLLAPCPAALSH